MSNLKQIIIEKPNDGLVVRHVHICTKKEWDYLSEVIKDLNRKSISNLYIKN